MSHLDPRSIVAVCSLLSLICAIMLLSIRRGLPVSIQGIEAWAGGTVAVFVAVVLIGQRDQLPDILTSVLANGLLWGGMASAAVGLRRFTGRSAPIAALCGGDLLFMAVSAWYVLVHPDYPMRLVSNAFFLMLIELVLLEAAWAVRPRNLPVKFMIACFAAAAGVGALRIVAIFAGVDKTASLFEPTFFQKLFLLKTGLAWLLASAAFALMINDRLHGILRHAAAYDPLSGLLNRGAVTMMLEREMDRSSRRKSPLSVLLVDIDNFKLVNDNYGHAVGDRTIVDFAVRAALQLRRSDLLGRYGGEEFLAVLPETDVTIAAQVAERLRAGMAEPASGPDYTVSIGVARYTGGMTPDDLVRAADYALYQAKENGRNRVEVASGGLYSFTPAENFATVH